MSELGAARPGERAHARTRTILHKLGSLLHHYSYPLHFPLRLFTPFPPLSSSFFDYQQLVAVLIFSSSSLIVEPTVLLQLPPLRTLAIFVQRNCVSP